MILYDILLITGEGIPISMQWRSEFPAGSKLGNSEIRGKEYICIADQIFAQTRSSVSDA